MQINSYCRIFESKTFHDFFSLSNDSCRRRTALEAPVREMCMLLSNGWRNKGKGFLVTLNSDACSFRLILYPIPYSYHYSKKWFRECLGLKIQEELICFVLRVKLLLSLLFMWNSLQNRFCRLFHVTSLQELSPEFPYRISHFHV